MYPHEVDFWTITVRAARKFWICMQNPNFRIVVLHRIIPQGRSLMASV